MYIHIYIYIYTVIARIKYVQLNTAQTLQKPLHKPSKNVSARVCVGGFV